MGKQGLLERNGDVIEQLKRESGKGTLGMEWCTPGRAHGDGEEE